MKKTVLTAAALSALIGMASTGALAQQKPATPAAPAATAPVKATPAAATPAKTEKCYGVAKAAKNDCKTAAHACAGKAAKAGEKHDFVAVPEGLCAKIAGGSLKNS